MTPCFTKRPVCLTIRIRHNEPRPVGSGAVPHIRKSPAPYRSRLVDDHDLRWRFSTCHGRLVRVQTVNMKRIMPIISSVVLLACLGGCVERELTITSEPSGALVYISDVEKGRTPLTINFAWYGDYDVILRHDGFNTLKTHAEIAPPIYEIPPLDLLSAIVPWTYHDRRYLHY